MYKVIPGYDNYFEISESGNIRSKRKDSYSTWEDKDGYLRIKLKGKHYSIHHLVCWVFNGEKPSENHQVNHIDGNRKNNHYLNLEWTTQKENIQHSMKYGEGTPPPKQFNNTYRAKEITLKCEGEIKSFPNQTKASEFLGRNGNYISKRKYRGHDTFEGVDGRIWEEIPNKKNK